MSAYITREEFGFALFEAIMLCGSILQLQHRREQTAPDRIKPGQLTEWQQAEKVLTGQLVKLANTLPDADVAELIRRYPFMANI